MRRGRVSGGAGSVKPSDEWRTEWPSACRTCGQGREAVRHVKANDESPDGRLNEHLAASYDLGRRVAAPPLTSSPAVSL